MEPVPRLGKLHRISKLRFQKSSHLGNCMILSEIISNAHTTLNIPHTSCLCDTCENSVLLAKGINSCKQVPNGLPETPHDIVKRYICSDQTAYMFNECSECEDGKLCELAADDNWSDSNSGSDSDTNANEVSFYKWETWISMSRKFGLRCHLTKPLRCLKLLSPS